MREITPDEVCKLHDCVRKLSEYHNEISVNFKGVFPVKPYEKTLENFKVALNRNASHISVIEDGETILGFCKIDIVDDKGKLDYLFVREESRGKGFGKELMDWAMEMFEQHNIRHIEVKVIDGNPAMHLYEKYGFKVKSHILGIER